MSRIAEGLKALKAERRSYAAKLRKLDRLIGGFDSFNATTVRRRRRRTKAKMKPIVKAKAAMPRRRTALAKAVAARSQGASFATAASD